MSKLSLEWAISTACESHDSGIEISDFKSCHLTVPPQRLQVDAKTPRIARVFWSTNLPRKVCATHKEPYVSEAKRDNNDNNSKICGSMPALKISPRGLCSCAMAAYVIFIPVMMMKPNLLQLGRNP